MVQPSTNNPYQLMTSINCHQVWPLVVTPIPLLHAMFYLHHVAGSQGQVLEMTTSGHGPRRNKVVEGETIKGTESTPRTLDGLMDHFC